MPDRDDPSLRELYKSLLGLRARLVVPGIPGCRSEAADVLGPGAVAARWRMGNGTLLTLAANLGAHDAAITPPAGDAVFGTDGAADAVRSGRLPACSAIAFITARS
jgi:hypothetical protein